MGVYQPLSSNKSHESNTNNITLAARTLLAVRSYIELLLPRPKPESENPKPQTLNPQLGTRNLASQKNPKPQNHKAPTEPLEERLKVPTQMARASKSACKPALSHAQGAKGAGRGGVPRKGHGGLGFRV